MGEIAHPKACFQVIDGRCICAREGLVEVRDDSLNVRGTVGWHEFADRLEELPEVTAVFISIV